MNFRDLKYLIAVADLQHFGQAALQCHVSQPTLSAQLKKLEEEIGVQLFERSNKQVITTPIGEKIVAQARVILHEMEQMRELAMQNKNPLSGVFKLGIIPTLGPYLLPYVIPLVRKHLPNIQLHLMENKTEELVHSIQQGTLDAVLLALPVNLPNCHHQSLFREPFFVAVPNHHTLANRAQLKISDMRGEKLLLLEEGHCLRDQALEVCNHIDIERDPAFSATSLETLRYMVAAGDGITLLPGLATINAPRDKYISILPFRSPMPARDVGLVWRKKSVRTLACYKLARLLTRVMNNIISKLV